MDRLLSNKFQTNMHIFCLQKPYLDTNYTQEKRENHFMFDLFRGPPTYQNVKTIQVQAE